jgi:dihydroneopterin aldolase
VASAHPGEGRIELHGLRLVGRHGVLPEEQRRAQPFEVDLTVWLDLRAAAASDELADTADYSALVSAATEIVGGDRHFQLMEAMADAVAAAVLARDPRLAAVEVAVRKLRPPVPHDLASAGVRLTRRRDGDGS